MIISNGQIHSCSHTVFKSKGKQKYPFRLNRL